MYCSSCGATVKPGLSYCNRCGAEWGAKERSATRRPVVSLDSLVWAIASVTIVGLGALIGLMAVMKEVLHFNDSLIIAFSLLCFLTFLGADSVFVWLLVRSSSRAREATEMAWQKRRGGIEGNEEQARTLPEAALSVTEHTTRRMEHAQKKEEEME